MLRLSVIGSSAQILTRRRKQPARCEEPGGEVDLKNSDRRTITFYPKKISVPESRFQAPGNEFKSGIQMNARRLVSIVIPAQKPDFLEAALRSAFSQTHDAVEIIVCDDCPDDSVQQVLEQLRPHSPWPLRHLRNDTPLGESLSLVRGIREAQGEYIKFLHDDALLQPGSSRPWSEFAALAKSVHVPWKTLRKPYAEALPGATISVDSPKLKTVRPGKQTPRVLLIADDLRNAGIAEQWVKLARRITRDKLNVTLLVSGHTPWMTSLLATGAVHALPKLQGLERAECVELSGCGGALSLDPDPGASWQAPTLAGALGLPLYAVPGALAQDARALSMHLLPFLPSRA